MIGSSRIIGLLLTRPELDVNVRTENDGNTALHLAATRDLEAVRLLLKAPGIGVNETNYSGNTPLMQMVLRTRLHSGDNDELVFRRLLDEMLRMSPDNSSAREVRVAKRSLQYVMQVVNEWLGSAKKSGEHPAMITVTNYFRSAENMQARVNESGSAG